MRFWILLMSDAVLILSHFLKSVAGSDCFEVNPSSWSELTDFPDDGDITHIKLLQSNSEIDSEWNDCVEGKTVACSEKKKRELSSESP